MRFKLSILTVFIVVNSCGNAELLDAPEYNAVVDYEANYFAVPFDMSYITSEREESTETLNFYSNKDKSHTIVRQLEDSVLAFYHHFWNFDGSKIYYRIGERVVESRRQGLFEYDVKTGQTNEIGSRFDILQSQQYGTMYQYLTEKPDGSMLILNNEYIWLKKENRSLTLNQFLDENGLLNHSNDYWFFGPSDSTYMVGHSRFIRWDKQGDLIAQRNFTQKKDTSRVQILYKLAYEQNVLSVVDSAINSPVEYDFDSNEYYTMNGSDVVRNSKSDSSTIKIGTLFSYHNATNLYPLKKTNAVLIQGFKKIAEGLYYSRVLHLDTNIGLMTNPFTKIIVSTVNEIDEENSIILVSQRLYAQKRVIMKTDLSCKNLVIVSDVNLYSRYPQKRPNID